MSNEIPTVVNWTSRIVGHDRVRADSLLANPFNHRRHPQKQRQVVAASISELGFVKSILVNKTTGRIIDGHERAMQALGCGDGTMVDVEYVELSEAEERKALLILDASSELATVDAEALQQLVDGMEMQDTSLQELLDDMARESGIVPQNFEPGTEDDQGRLDQLEPKMVRCPHCKKDFDCREQS